MWVFFSQNAIKTLEMYFEGIWAHEIWLNTRLFSIFVKVSAKKIWEGGISDKIYDSLYLFLRQN